MEALIHAIKQFFRKKPPKDLKGLFSFQVRDIEGYVLDFLRKETELPMDKLKREEITYFALFIASEAWNKAELGPEVPDLNVLQNAALAQSCTKPDDEFELKFNSKIFQTRSEEYRGLISNVLSSLNKDKVDIDDNSSGIYVMQVVGNCTQYQLPVHKLLFCEMAFVRTIDFINFACNNFKIAAKKK